MGKARSWYGALRCSADPLYTHEVVILTSRYPMAGDAC